jgi:hypothetical protein
VTDLVAWADLHDARARLVLSLTAEGLTPVQVADKLSMSADEAELAALCETAEPTPGSSRYQAAMWKARTEALTTELLAATEAVLREAFTERERTSATTHVRELAPSITLDPDACSCRRWSDAPMGAHHPLCPAVPGELPWELP